MATKLLSKKLSEIRVESSTPEYVCDYLCDAEADISTLPVCGAGSSAVCIDTGAIYLVNTQGVWTKFGG